MPDDALGRPYGVPARRAPVLPNGVLGMLIFVATEIMFFSGLISAFVIGKSNAIGGWPPPGQPRLIGADASHAWISAWCPTTGVFGGRPCRTRATFSAQRRRAANRLSWVPPPICGVRMTFFIP